MEKNDTAPDVGNKDGLAGGDVVHTPGPWIAEMNLRGSGYYIKQPEHNRDLACVNERLAGIERAECVANALLMAAAPAMLAALRAAEAALQSCYEVTEFPAGGQSDCDSALAAIRAALAQAMGEPANNPLTGADL